MKQLIFAFLLLILSVTVIAKKKAFLKQPPKKSTLFLAIDDIVSSIQINGNEYLKNEENKGWKTTYKYELGLLPGDYISITGKNGGNQKNNSRNPAGIIGSLHYQAPDGKMTIINTNDKDWKCDDDTPVNLGLNSKNTWKFQWKDIEKNAMIIWGKKKEGTTTCTYTIPCS